MLLALPPLQALVFSLTIVALQFAPPCVRVRSIFHRSLTSDDDDRGVLVDRSSLDNIDHIFQHRGGGGAWQAVLCDRWLPSSLLPPPAAAQINSLLYAESK